jgi:2-polyprenyl-6-hydroxyphenyl methylase/3-demethylubiquinone-9 3-methyltransferase
VGRLLDCGCGVGDNLRDLAGRADELIGVDLAPANVTAATENLAASGIDSRIELAPVEKLPFEDGSIDCVLLLDVIEHVIDRPAATRVIARVLAPGGLLIVATPVKSVLEGWTRVDQVLGAPVHLGVRLAKRLLGKPAGRSAATDAIHESFLTEPELAGYVAGAGLEVREHTRICFYPGPEGGGAFLHVVRALGALPGGARIRAAISRQLERVERRKRLNQKQLIVAAKPR